MSAPVRATERVGARPLGGDVTIAEATTDEKIRACFPVIVQLRPHLDEAGFVEQVRRMNRDGYRLIALEHGGQVRALAGVRVFEMLAYGRLLYVDDLITDADGRSRGYGALLFDRLKAMAVAEDCEAVHLDSGVQRARAHRFYFREGMHIPSYHFSVGLEGDEPGRNGT